MIVWRVAASIAAAGLVAQPAMASRSKDQSAAALFVRARAAELIGAPAVAAQGYASALAAAPGDEGLAQRAYRQAIAAGDFTLAARAAALLQAKGTLPPDGQLFLLADAVRKRHWAAASETTDVVAKDELFAFLLPTLRAWIAFGSGAADPLALLDKPEGALASAYGAEHRALIQLAAGKVDDGVAAIRAMPPASDARQARLRLVAAAALQKAGRKADAAALLAGKDSATVAGRALVLAGKPIPAPMVTPADGLAELFARVAIDINRERVTPLSVTLARLATMLAPANAETWLVTSELLAAASQPEAALDCLAQVKPNDPFAAYARASRIQILARAERGEEALAEALKAAKAPGAGVSDWARVADLYARLDRQAEAADAYSKALALSEKSGDEAEPRWTLWLLRGGAREQAGQWAAAKADLIKAAELAPDQPAVLNYLGYAQIERRENLVEARKLIEKASSLRPEDAAITDSLGWAYYLDGDITKAIDTLERAVAGEPGEPTINEHLGDAYWSAGRRREARFAWRAALVHAEADDAKRISTKLDTGLTPAVAAP